MGEVWGDINADLLQTIAKYTTTKDHIVLRAVCKSWGSILSSNLTLSSSQQQLPWGLFPSRRPGRCLLYSLAEKQQYLIDLPEFYHYRCCGSSHGWLIFTDDTPAMFMLNPLTRRRIELPPITTILARGSFIEYNKSNVGNEYLYTVLDGTKVYRCSDHMKQNCITKVILTGNPSFDKAEDYLIIALSSVHRYIGFCRAGDDKWTSVNMDCPSIRFMCDIVYWKGSLYGICEGAEITKCDDLLGPVPTMKKLIACSKLRWLNVSDFAITENENASPSSSSLNFLVVYRKFNCFPEEEEKVKCFCRGCYSNIDDEESETPYDDDYDIFTDLYDHDADADADGVYDVVDEENEEEGVEKYFYSRTDKLVVYMFNEEQQQRAYDIGDKTLFLGTNSSMVVVPTRDFPECKPNHIYFSHSYHSLGCKENDMGVMNIKNNKRESFSGCSRLSCNLPKPFVPHFVWFIPSL